MPCDDHLLDHGVELSRNGHCSSRPVMRWIGVEVLLTRAADHIVGQVGTGGCLFQRIASR